MKIGAQWLLAKAVVVESVRRKDLWVLAIVGSLFILSAQTIGLLGAKGIEVFLKDLTVTVLGLFSTVIAVLTSVRLIPEELKQKTLYPLLSRPITRLDFVLGKWLGAVLVSWIGFLALCACAALALASFGVHFEPIVYQYILLKMFGLALLCAITLTFSLYMTPQAAATFAFILAFGGSMISRTMTLVFPTASPAGKIGLQASNLILPQYSLFDIGSRVANLDWPPVGPWVVGFLAAYCFVYSGLFLYGAWFKFSRRAL